MTDADHSDSRRAAQRWCQKGRELAGAGKHREAVEAFSMALRENAELAEAYFGRSASHYLLGRYSQATTDLDAASLLGCRDAQFWSRYESGVAAGEDGQEDS